MLNNIKLKSNHKLLQNNLIKEIIMGDYPCVKVI